jgi:transposase InsO family protein
LATEDIAIDDHSRLAYAEIGADERAETTVGFVRRALEFFECAGIETRRVLTYYNQERPHGGIDGQPPISWAN